MVEEFRLKSRRGNPIYDRPLCPIHGLAMLVGRTIQDVQYRYCRVEGCTQSCITMRARSPHKFRADRCNPVEKQGEARESPPSRGAGDSQCERAL